MFIPFSTSAKMRKSTKNYSQKYSGVYLCTTVYVQLTLLVVYRYVQSSIDTSLYHNEVQFSSPGFILAGDDLPKPPPPPPAKEPERGRPTLTNCKSPELPSSRTASTDFCLHRFS